MSDAHVHVCFNGREPVHEPVLRPVARLAVEAAQVVAKMLWCGITAVRDLDGVAGVDIAIRDAIAAGVIPGPRLRVAGHPICQKGGQGYFLGGEADGPDAVRRAARHQRKAGTDLIKVMVSGGAASGQDVQTVQLSPEQLRAAVDVAHAAGTHVAALHHGTHVHLRDAPLGRGRHLRPPVRRDPPPARRVHGSQPAPAAAAGRADRRRLRCGRQPPRPPTTSASRHRWSGPWPRAWNRYRLWPPRRGSPPMPSAWTTSGGRSSRARSGPVGPGRLHARSRGGAGHRPHGSGRAGRGP